MELFAPNIAVIGPSGSGKSTSIENLPQDDTTALLLSEPKSLPFSHNFPIIEINESHREFVPQLTKLKAIPSVKRVVIDSISEHLERCLQYCRFTYKNFDIWSTYGRLGFELLNAMSDKRVIIIALSIDESVEQEVVDPNQNGQLVTLYKRMAAVGMGKELLGKIEKKFTIVAHTVVKQNLATKKIEHLFQIKPSPNTTAKSPRAMFTDKAYESGYCANDLNLVLKEIESKVGFKCF